MKQEREIQRRLHSLASLRDAVTAMKTLSAHHFREARRAVDATRIYREGIDRLVAETGASLSAGTGSAGILVLGGELGLCGGYNRQIVGAAAARRAELGPGPTFVMGTRAAALLRHHGLEATRCYRTPTSAHQVTDLLLELGQEILHRYVDEELSRVDVVYARFEGVGAYTPTILTLLPVQSEPPEEGLARYASPDYVAGVVIRELLYIAVDGVLVEALASEHGARLAATQAAETWLDRRIETLSRRLTSARREASTQEVIEIASGARARHDARSRSASSRGSR